LAAAGEQDRVPVPISEAASLPDRLFPRQPSSRLERNRFDRVRFGLSINTAVRPTASRASSSGFENRGEMSTRSQPASMSSSPSAATLGRTWSSQSLTRVIGGTRAFLFRNEWKTGTELTGILFNGELCKR